MSYNLDTQLTVDELWTEFESAHNHEEQMEVIERTYNMGFYGESGRMSDIVQKEMAEQYEHLEFARQ